MSLNRLRIGQRLALIFALVIRVFGVKAGVGWQLGEIFVSVGGLKKGDTLTVDWVPERGTLIELNGKSLGDPLADQAFYNALLKIWLGDKPADAALKPLLMGAQG